MNAPIPLSMLSPGECGEIAELVGSTTELLRLAEIGLRAGSSVEMVQAGTPCIIRLAGHKLCFRESEAFSILVRARASG